MERYDIRVNVWGDVSWPQYEWETVKAEDGDFVLARDAQATVEALQKQLDHFGDTNKMVLAGDYVTLAQLREARANDLERDCKDLQSDIEDERAKAGNLLKKIAYWEKRHRTYKELAEENMNCKQASIDAHKDAYDELESQHADLLPPSTRSGRR